MISRRLLLVLALASPGAPAAGAERTTEPYPGVVHIHRTDNGAEAKRARLARLWDAGGRYGPPRGTRGCCRRVASDGPNRRGSQALPACGTTRVLAPASYCLVAQAQASAEQLTLPVHVHAGLTPLQALQSATTRAAALLRREADLGQIAPGFVADPVAVPGNPLEDVTVLERPLFLMKNGRVHKRP